MRRGVARGSGYDGIAIIRRVTMARCAESHGRQERGAVSESLGCAALRRLTTGFCPYRTQCLHEAPSLRRPGIPGLRTSGRPLVGRGVSGLHLHRARVYRGRADAWRRRRPLPYGPHLFRHAQRRYGGFRRRRGVRPSGSPPGRLHPPGRRWACPFRRRERAQGAAPALCRSARRAIGGPTPLAAALCAHCERVCPSDA